MTRSQGGRPIVVTGCPRSGTTWVGKMIGASRDVFYIYEPFNDGVHHHVPVPRFAYLTDGTAAPVRPQIDRLMRLGDLPYRAQRSVRGLLEATRRQPEISGRLAAAQLVRKRDQFLSAKRVCIKDPLAFYAAEWLKSRYDTQTIVMLRHPAGVISSYLALDWESELGAIVDHPLPDRAQGLAGEIERYRSGNMSRLDALILQWKIFTHASLDMKARHPDWLFIIHEELCLRPQDYFAALFDWLELDFTPELQATIRKSSSSENVVDTGHHAQHNHHRASQDLVDAWRQRLEPDVSDRILRETGDLWEEVNDCIAPPDGVTGR